MRQDGLPARVLSQYIHGDYSAPNLFGAFYMRPHRVVYTELVSFLDIPFFVGVAGLGVTGEGVTTDSVDSGCPTFISSAVFVSISEGKE
jgi:hypothetical protein